MAGYVVSDDVTMEQLLSESAEISLPENGKVVKGKVISKSKSQILVDVGGVATGIITGRELNDSVGTAKKIKVGDVIVAVTLENENEDGCLVLSLRKAGQFNTWDKFKVAMESGEVVDVVPTQANKGGLLVDLDGIKAFIPVSQLAPEHYPRVENSDSGKILHKLQKLIGRVLHVRVINVDQASNKMILSEKEARKGEYDQSLKDLKPGDVIKGRVTGVSKFGFFVAFNELEGLVHISEIAWGHVSNPSQYARVGEDIDVKVIGIEGDKISLSLKRMQEDPWVTLTQKYLIGDIVKGTINKLSEFGAFVTLDDEVNGLIHLSEIAEDAQDARDYFDIGDEIKAKIVEVNTEEHRIALSVKGMGYNKKEGVRPKSEKSDDSEAMLTKVKAARKSTKKVAEEDGVNEVESK